MSKVIAFLVFCLLAFMLYAALTNIPIATQSVELIQTFGSDEAREVRYMKRHLDTGDMSPLQYQYGYTYYYMIYSAISALRGLGYDGGAVDVSLIALTMRYLSLLSAIFCLVFIFRICILLTAKRHLALLAVLGFASTASFYRWAQLIHPDTLHLTFLLAAAYVTLLAPQLPASAYLCSFLVGLAFGTKHFGLAALPFLLFPCVYASSRDARHDRKTVVLTVIRLGLASSLACFLGWWLFNHHLFFHLRAWSEKLASLSEFMLNGGSRPRSMTENPLRWFTILAGEYGIPSLFCIITGLFAYLGVGRIRREAPAGSKESTEVRARAWWLWSIGAWCLFVLVYMMLRVRYREARFLLPLTPFILVLGVYGIHRILELGAIRSSLAYSTLCTSFVFLCFASSSVSAIEREAVLSQKMSSPRVALGGFLRDNFPSTARILYDWYTYVPPYFERKRSVMGITRRSTQQFKPEILVFYSGTTGRWAWKAPGTKFRDGKFERGPWTNPKRFAELVKLFRRLLKKGSKHRIVYETEDIMVFSRIPLSSDRY